MLICISWNKKTPGSFVFLEGWKTKGHQKGRACEGQGSEFRSQELDFSVCCIFLLSRKKSVGQNACTWNVVLIWNCRHHQEFAEFLLQFLWIWGILPFYEKTIPKLLSYWTMTSPNFLHPTSFHSRLKRPRRARKQKRRRARLPRRLWRPPLARKKSPRRIPRRKRKASWWRFPAGCFDGGDRTKNRCFFDKRPGPDLDTSQMIHVATFFWVLGVFYRKNTIFSACFNHLFWCRWQILGWKKTDGR